MRVPVSIAAALCAFLALASCHLMRDKPAQAQPEKSTDKPPSPSVPKDLILNARMDVMRLTGAGLEDITVVSAESVSWPDAALGCPTPGMVYPQEVTPGYQIKLRARGEIFDYHAGRTGSPVLCPAERAKPPLPASPMQQEKNMGKQPSSSPSPSPSSSVLDQLIVRAKTDTVRRTGTKREAIVVISANEVSWPDPSLGCPRRGVMYPQVITPGYQIKLRAGSEILDYRAARTGSIQLCPPELAKPPVSGSPDR